MFRPSSRLLALVVSSRVKMEQNLCKERTRASPNSVRLFLWQNRPPHTLSTWPRQAGTGWPPEWKPLLLRTATTAHGTLKPFHEIRAPRRHKEQIEEKKRHHPASPWTAAQQRGSSRHRSCRTMRKILGSGRSGVKVSSRYTALGDYVLTSPCPQKHQEKQGQCMYIL